MFIRIDYTMPRPSPHATPILHDPRQYHETHDIIFVIFQNRFIFGILEMFLYYPVVDKCLLSFVACAGMLLRGFGSPLPTRLYSLINSTFLS